MSGIGTGEMEFEFGTVLKRTPGFSMSNPIRVLYLGPRGSNAKFWGIVLVTGPERTSAVDCEAIGLLWRGVSGYWMEDDQWPGT